MINKYLILVLPLIFILILDIVLYDIFAAGNSNINKLNVMPSKSNVYAMGNSMFKTGIDFELLNNILSKNDHVDFEYHNGHYTNLWYLIIKKSIVPAMEHPKLIIWGFRPTYAILPAFRQKKVGSIEKFYNGGDTYYEAKISHHKLSVKEYFNVWLENNTFFYGKRSEIKNVLSKFTNKTGTYLLKILMPDMQFRDLEENIISKELSVSDMIVKRFSKGNFVMVEETVADRGDKFIKGKKVRFKDSFIPDITTMISNAGIPQLVLIFKPVAYFNDKLDPESIKFADDAENYFISNNISYINFMKDNRIAIKFYANGDHYNQEGREFITKIVGEKLNFQLENIN